MTTFLVFLGKRFRPIFYVTAIVVIVVGMYAGAPDTGIRDTPLSELTLRQIGQAIFTGAWAGRKAPDANKRSFKLFVGTAIVMALGYYAMHRFPN